MNTELSSGSQGLPLGFEWGAVAAGIKASGKLDVAVAVAPKGAQAAAMFTSNTVVAAPVTVGRRHLLATGGKVGAVLVNAGNANCATGQAGIDACVHTCAAAAETFGCIFDEVFPSSTGIIGVPFPAEKVVAAMPSVKDALGSTAADEGGACGD
jgi:glutamate N-acetyltransferase/amino-acid N-acetyltransferase